MKKNTWIICLLLCAACAMQAKERVIERPPFIAWNSTSIEIDKLVISDTATVAYIKAFYRPKFWIKIAKGSFLADPDGQLYPIRRGIGITLDEEFWMPESGEAEFQLVFPPLPENVTWVDFSEGDMEGAFKIWGIQLDKKAFYKRDLPKEAIVHKINKEAALPVPEFAYGKATVKGKIMDYREGMPQAGRLHLLEPLRWTSSLQEINIHEDGTFEVEIDVITTTPAIFSFPFAQVSCLLAPGKETKVLINPAEYCRQQSQLHKNAKPYGKKAYFEGYLAALQQELSDNTIKTNLAGNPRSHFDRIADKDANSVKEYFTELRRNTLQEIEKADMSRAAKEVLAANTDNTTAINILMADDMMKQAHMFTQKLNREQANEYYRDTRIEMPEDFYSVLKELSINTPANLYTPEFAYIALVARRYQELLQKTLGTSEGVLFQTMEALKYYRSIEDFTPLTAEQKATLDALPEPAYKELLTALNNELLRKIEENKKKSGFTVNEVGEVSNEELFSSILAKYKGHVLLVDFWATWCGPCRMANKTMIPMKEELKDKDIIYVYITGETSPKGVWENMIPDIHGEHFRLTNEQYNYLRTNLKIEGVPTYFVVDREGKTTYRSTGFPGTGTMKEQLLKVLN
ncbi:TlpA family protein disulfide reductase [Bacteroides pyogenes]|uniref:TlpA family protein disulfide reductase n=1 Tax=Bacteroides pyogenes TaxID=310300 RepID=UPI0004058D04|nr:TlpA disulfide reductase family protein [Bacteroides pyogenes]